MELTTTDLKEFLDEKYDLYNQLNFIESDPISIPHLYSVKEDIEIAAFLTAVIAWGQRKTILVNANKMMQIMGKNPYDFIMTAKHKDFDRFHAFVHRTFNGSDTIFFMKSLQNIYKKHNGLENAFASPMHENRAINLGDSIVHFRKLFFSISGPTRTYKHISNPQENSSAKRLCMFLRWMIRTDKRGVDFGIWHKNGIHPENLMCPLDVHSGNVARKLGILQRKQNDWKAVEELTAALRNFDAEDPVKYDFALFGLGVFEKF